jgi:hypothetical protein
VSQGQCRRLRPGGTVHGYVVDRKVVEGADACGAEPGKLIAMVLPEAMIVTAADATARRSLCGSKDDYFGKTEGARSMKPSPFSAPRKSTSASTSRAERCSGRICVSRCGLRTPPRW